MSELYKCIYRYIQNLDWHEKNKSIESEVNNTFNELCDYETMNDIIDKCCIKYDENNIYRCILYDLSDDLKGLKILLYHVLEYKYYDLKINDIKTMCFDCIKIEKLYDDFKIKYYDDYYNPLLAYFKDTYISMKPKRNLYIELLIKEHDIKVNITENDNINDLVIKINKRYKPYLNDLIKFYKLLNKDVYNE